MPGSPVGSPAPSVAVLAVGRQTVEWLSTDRKGRTVYGSAEVLGGSPADAASAAAGLLARLKVRPESCVLALGQGMLEKKWLNLPEVSKKELAQIVRRKAANLLDAEERDVLYNLLPLGAETRERNEGGSLRRYLLLAQRRGEAKELLLSLRRRGFKIKQVTSLRYASLSRAGADDHGEDTASVTVTAGFNSVSVSALSQGRLIYSSEIGGDIRASSTLASSLLQEVRGCESHWKKTSRGGRISDIHLIGLPAEASAHLEPALHAILSGARIHKAPEGDEGGLDAARIALLACSRLDPIIPLDLKVSLPPTNTAILTTATSAVLLTCGAVFVGRDELARSIEDLRLRAADARHQVQQIEESVQRAGLLERARAQLATERQKIRHVADAGLPMAGLLADVSARFEGRAELLSISVIDGRLSITAETDPNPMESMIALDEIVRGLEQSSDFEEVELRLPTTLPSGGRAGVEQLPFSIVARLEPRR